LAVAEAALGKPPQPLVVLVEVLVKMVKGTEPQQVQKTKVIVAEMIAVMTNIVPLLAVAVAALEALVGTRLIHLLAAMVVLA
jgi:hypothetical protein